MHCECKNAPSPDCASCSKPLFHQTGVQYDGRLYHNDCFRCSICLRRFGRNQKPIECRIANRLVCESCRSKDLRNAHKVAGQQRTCVLCQSALTNSPSHIKRDSSSPPARSEPSSSPNNHYHCNSCRQHRVVRKPLPTNSTSHHEFGHRVTGGRSPLVATALANPVSPNIAQLMHKLERTAIGSSRRTRSADPHPHHYYHHTCHKHSDHQQPKVCNNCAECTCNRARRRAHSCHTSPIARRAIVYDRYAAKPTSPRSSNRSVRSFGCDCKCWRCQRPVYENEKVWSLQRAWHRSCLRCVLCDAALSPGMHSVSPDGRPICNFPCSNRLYGSARYGYGCRERHT